MLMIMERMITNSMFIVMSIIMTGVQAHNFGGSDHDYDEYARDSGDHVCELTGMVVSMRMLGEHAHTQLI